MDPGDIYEDLETFDVTSKYNEVKEQKEQLELKCKELEEIVETQSKRITELEKENEALRYNISSTFKTAKFEVTRKSKLVRDLQRNVDNIAFRRPGYNAIPEENEMQDIKPNTDNIAFRRPGYNAIPEENEEPIPKPPMKRPLEDEIIQNSKRIKTEYENERRNTPTDRRNTPIENLQPVKRSHSPDRRKVSTPHRSKSGNRNSRERSDSRRDSSRDFKSPERRRSPRRNDRFDRGRRRSPYQDNVRHRKPDYRRDRDRYPRDQPKRRFVYSRDTRRESLCRFDNRHRDIRSQSRQPFRKPKRPHKKKVTPRKIRSPISEVSDVLDIALESSFFDTEREPTPSTRSNSRVDESEDENENENRYTGGFNLFQKRMIQKMAMREEPPKETQQKLVPVRKINIKDYRNSIEVKPEILNNLDESELEKIKDNLRKQLSASSESFDEASMSNFNDTNVHNPEESDIPVAETVNGVDWEVLEPELILTESNDPPDPIKPKKFIIPKLSARKDSTVEENKKSTKSDKLHRETAEQKIKESSRNSKNSTREKNSVPESLPEEIPTKPPPREKTKSRRKSIITPQSPPRKISKSPDKEKSLLSETLSKEIPKKVQKENSIPVHRSRTKSRSKSIVTPQSPPREISKSLLKEKDLPSKSLPEDILKKVEKEDMIPVHRSRTKSRSKSTVTPQSPPREISKSLVKEKDLPSKSLPEDILKKVEKEDMIPVPRGRTKSPRKSIFTPQTPPREISKSPVKENDLPSESLLEEIPKKIVKEDTKISKSPVKEKNSPSESLPDEILKKVEKEDAISVPHEISKSPVKEKNLPSENLHNETLKKVIKEDGISVPRSRTNIRRKSIFTAHSPPSEIEVKFPEAPKEKSPDELWHALLQTNSSISIVKVSKQNHENQLNTKSHKSPNELQDKSTVSNRKPVWKLSRFTEIEVEKSKQSYEEHYLDKLNELRNEASVKAAPQHSLPELSCEVQTSQVAISKVQVKMDDDNIPQISIPEVESFPERSIFDLSRKTPEDVLSKVELKVLEENISQLMLPEFESSPDDPRNHDKIFQKTPEKIFTNLQKTPCKDNFEQIRLPEFDSSPEEPKTDFKQSEKTPQKEQNGPVNLSLVLSETSPDEPLIPINNNKIADSKLPFRKRSNSKNSPQKLPDPVKIVPKTPGKNLEAVLNNLVEKATLNSKQVEEVDPKPGPSKLKPRKCRRKSIMIFSDTSSDEELAEIAEPKRRSRTKQVDIPIKSPEKVEEVKIVKRRGRPQLTPNSGTTRTRRKTTRSPLKQDTTESPKPITVNSEENKPVSPKTTRPLRRRSSNRDVEKTHGRTRNSRFKSDESLDTVKSKSPDLNIEPDSPKKCPLKIKFKKNTPSENLLSTPEVDKNVNVRSLRNRRNSVKPSLSSIEETIDFVVNTTSSPKHNDIENLLNTLETPSRKTDTETESTNENSVVKQRLAFEEALTKPIKIQILSETVIKEAPLPETTKNDVFSNIEENLAKIQTGSDEMQLLLENPYAVLDNNYEEKNQSNRRKSYDEKIEKLKISLMEVEKSPTIASTDVPETIASTDVPENKNEPSPEKSPVVFKNVHSVYTKVTTGNKVRFVIQRNRRR